MFQLDADLFELAKIGQAAEHNFVGVKCGIMDQFANLLSKEKFFARLDCRSLEYEYFPFETDEYQILLCDTGVKHSLAGSAYNKRREQCEKGVRVIKKDYPEICNLRDVSLEQLTLFKDILDNTIYKRCEYVIQENQRVGFVSKVMMKKDFKQLGALLYASHEGLSKQYEVSCSELDFLVEMAKNDPDVIGARMMGGGFGGCTINLVKVDSERFIEKIKKGYSRHFGLELKVYPVRIVDGTATVLYQT